MLNLAEISTRTSSMRMSRLPKEAGPTLNTPRQDGFRMPAEWEEHAGCWMLWPSRKDVWRLDALPGRTAFAQVANTIAESEAVMMGVAPGDIENARAMLSGSVNLMEMPYNDVWTRDMGPTFVVNDRGDVRGIDWQFNAWGGLYADYTQDQIYAGKVLSDQAKERYVASIVMEGGAIHTDGQGTLMVVEENLLNPNRNPHMTKQEIEKYLMEYVNAEKVIWLPYGVFLDETGGHVDNMATFTQPGVVAMTWTNDTNDPQYERSQAALEVLSKERDAKGRRFDIYQIHQPGPLTVTAEESASIMQISCSEYLEPGDRLAGSYINYYPANKGIVVPIFGDKHDDEALRTIEMLYPGRKVTGVMAKEVLLGGGNIHCVTQQQPKGKRK